MPVKQGSSLQWWKDLFTEVKLLSCLKCKKNPEQTTKQKSPATLGYFRFSRMVYVKALK